MKSGLRNWHCTNRELCNIIVLIQDSRKEAQTMMTFNCQTPESKRVPTSVIVALMIRMCRHLLPAVIVTWI